MDINSMSFLRDSLSHHYELRNAMDQKASFLSALAGVIFGLSVSHLRDLHFLILAIASFFTVFISIMIVCLPYRGKITNKLGLLCWWGFLGKNFKEYQDELDKVFSSEKNIAEEYELEIWNLANYSLKPKSKLLKLASFILIFGLLAGFVLFFV